MTSDDNPEATIAALRATLAWVKKRSGEHVLANRFANVIPLAATLNLLSGIYPYGIASTGFSSACMRSRAGITNGLGAVAARVAVTMSIARYL